MNNEILRSKLRLSIGIIGLLKYSMPWLPDSDKNSAIAYHEKIVQNIKEKLLPVGTPAPANNIIPTAPGNKV